MLSIKSANNRFIYSPEDILPYANEMAVYRIMEDIYS